MAFVATATGCVYTHYFALFLLLGLATLPNLFDVWRWQPASLRRRKSVAADGQSLPCSCSTRRGWCALCGCAATEALDGRSRCRRRCSLTLNFTGGESVLERIGCGCSSAMRWSRCAGDHAAVALWRNRPARRVYAAWLLAPV